MLDSVVTLNIIYNLVLLVILVTFYLCVTIRRHFITLHCRRNGIL